MGLSIRGTVREGVRDTLSVPGTLLVGLFFFLTYAMEYLIGGLRESVSLGGLESMLTLTPYTVSTSMVGAALPVATVAGLLVYISLSIISIRSFLAADRDRIVVDTGPVELLLVAGRLVLVGLAVLVATFIGSAFLLLPGLFFMVTFFFYAIPIAKGSGMIDALKESRRLASGNRIRLFVLLLILVLVSGLLEVAAYLVGTRGVGMLLISLGTVFGIASTVAAYRRLGGEGL